MFRYTVLLMVLVLFAGACSERGVDYVGTSYSSTTHVDLYFSEFDVVEDYVVMGRAVARAGKRVSNKRLQEKLLQEAREKGADGVIIHEFDRVPVGEITNENTIGNTTITTTTVREERRIEATFIKYKRNL